ncbi:MAG: phosphoribosylformylglycinamidine synthase [Micavibrio sp.]|jgi:phosphoribosylformylglycinamidine synthase|nr:phosphoribosylformylglycinamidine synthase [Micavibrio sp.]HCK31916.1 phosphoribosylformylglycinamidine synthase [Rhodospirillaceae bacterium]|tara:strand:- start:510 stop:740 length:231 start_codon:yes stop_codon:yes gene_type:complete
MKAIVTVNLKNGVLDPQGKAIAHTLVDIGYPEVQGARQGKVIELDLADGTPKEKIEEMCDKLLANPVIESYSIEVA